MSALQHLINFVADHQAQLPDQVPVEHGKLLPPDVHPKRLVDQVKILRELGGVPVPDLVVSALDEISPML